MTTSASSGLRPRQAVVGVLLLLLLLVTAILGCTVVFAWVSVGGTEVLQGPAHTARTSGLLIAAVLALFAAAVGAVLVRFRAHRMSMGAVVGFGFGAWIGELLVLLVLGPVIADELGRSLGTVVSIWVVATAGIVQPIAFVVGGVAGRQIRPDQIESRSASPG